MTPEEYERFKDAEKAHLRQLKALKKAVRLLERQKKIQSSLADMTRSSAEALEAQEEMIDRLALETAQRQARLEVALESGSDAENTKRADPIRSERADEELHRARARALVEKLKRSSDPTAAPERERSPRTERTQPGSTERDGPRSTEPTRPASREPADSPPAGPPEADANPTRGRTDRPEKTIGRM